MTAHTEHYRTIPALAAYIDRIANGADVVQHNFRTIAIIGHREGGYEKERATIKFGKDGTVKAPDAYLPTEDEANAIKSALAANPFPNSIQTHKRGAEEQRQRIGVSEDDWFVLLDKSRDNVLMCQQRTLNENGKKNYLPWTFWDDGRWRSMEPDDALPFWRPPQHRNMPFIMVHEGAKAARYVDWLVNSDDADAIEARAHHPWISELSDYEHFGWIGGALRPHATDWKELVRENPKEIVVVCDKDLPGLQAITPIARALSAATAPVVAVFFDDSFKEGFDLADEFPAKFWVKERYRGPTLADCSRPATWATKKIETDGRPRIVAKQAFIAQWVASIVPAVFVHRRYPNRLLDTAQFNAAMMPFSDAKKDTATVLGKEAAAQVDGVAYEPGRNQGIVTMDGLRLFNCWTPTRIGRRAGDIGPWDEFMRRLIPNETDRDHVLRWCATLIAQPDIRMRYGLLLISECQGVGKGTLMEKILAPLVGWHNVSVPSEKQLTESNFNSWLVRHRLIIVHEIYAGHSKKAYDNVKSSVTDDVLDVNEKNMKPYRINNWTHFVLSSNSFLALRMVKGDRRWFVPTVTEKKPETKYWTDLNAWLISGGLEAVHDWAYRYVSKQGSVGSGDEAPTSEAKDKLIETSRSEGQQMAFDLGETLAQSPRPHVIRDRDVRKWIADSRQMNEHDPKLESLLTVRGQLKLAGMVEVAEGKNEGRRWTAFANRSAMDLVGWSPWPTWGRLVPYWKPDFHDVIRQELPSQDPF